MTRRRESAAIGGIAALLVVVYACGGADAPLEPPAPGTPSVAAVVVTPAVAGLEAGDTVRLAATVRDSAGNVLDRSITWTSSAPALASVSADGLVTGLAAGPATITAASGGRSGTASLSVAPPAPIASVTLDRSTATVALRQMLPLTAVLRDSTGRVRTGRTVTWTTSDTAVAVVQAGVVTARGMGTATITATAEGRSAAAAVTVMAFAAITAGYAESCALTADGRLFCAGLRSGSRARPVAPSMRFTAVFASARLHDVLCAIAVGGALHCWGSNASGELGVGDSVVRGLPTAVLGGRQFRQVAFGQGIRGGLIIGGVPVPAEPANHTCGVTTDDELWCWGDGRSGQFGTGALTAATAPVRAGGAVRYTEVAAGRMYTCARGEEGRTWCWGDNETGHLGIGSWSATPTATPDSVAGGHRFTGLSGDGATCGLAADSTAWCWGDNGLLKVGAPATVTCFGGKWCVTAPVRVDAQPFATLQSSQYSTCARTASGGVWCWGMNIDGKFGTTVPPGCATGTAPAACTATPIAGPTGFRTLSVASNTACGMHQDGGAYCWGGNAFGQLGAPGVAQSTQPLVFAVDPDALP